MGFVIVDGDSLALFTALKNSPRNVISGIAGISGISVTPYKAYKICHFVGLKKSKYYSHLFLQKRRLKNSSITRD